MILANLIDVRSNTFNDKDGEMVKGLICTFLVESKDNKYCPNLIAFWVHADSQIGQIISYSLKLGKDFFADGGHATDIEGLCIYDVAFDYDKNKKLQHLKYCKAREN